MSNSEMVDKLVEDGRIETERVEEAFRSVDRKDFVPPEKENEAYRDRPLRIGENSTISAPHMVAINTELLQVRPDSNVLEVGSGSGYQIAILSELADEALGLERNRGLVEKSRERLNNRDNIEIIHGSSLDIFETVFDRILFSCAINSIDRATEVLDDGGTALAPVSEERGQILKRLKSGEIEKHGRVRFVECQ